MQAGKSHRCITYVQLNRLTALTLKGIPHVSDASLFAHRSRTLHYPRRLLFGMGAAGAAPAVSPLPQPTVNGVDFAGALPQQSAQKGKTQAQAWDAIALGVSVQGGTAVTNAKNFSAPAAVSIGQNLWAEAWGVKPGLALAVAGPNSTARVLGDTPVEREGEWGLAGDF